MNNAILIDAEDDVAVTIEPIAKGATILLERGLSLSALEDIPVYHKVAVRLMPAGHKVRKYGEHIGQTLMAIAAGSHVHVHNMLGVRENLDH